MLMNARTASDVPFIPTECSFCRLFVVESSESDANDDNEGISVVAASDVSIGTFGPNVISLSDDEYE